MRIGKFLLAGVLLSLVGFAACLRAADALAAKPAGNAAPAATAPAPPGLEDIILPSEVFTPGSLERVLNQIHDFNPGFNAIVVRDTGVKSDYPVLPEMRLKNVSIGQFIQFIASTYPSVVVQPVTGAENSPTLYSFHIALSNQNDGGTVPQQMAIYRLADIVNGMGANPKALDSVLSLIKNALDACPDQTPNLLKVHPETQTLIFRGSKEQADVVYQVIGALTPNAQKLESAEVQQMRNLITTQQNQLLQIQVELAKTREMLKSQSPATRP